METPAVKPTISEEDEGGSPKESKPSEEANDELNDRRSDEGKSPEAIEAKRKEDADMSNEGG